MSRPRAALALALVALAGCNAILGIDDPTFAPGPDVTGGDASSSDAADASAPDASADAPADAPADAGPDAPCDLAKPFDAPAPLASVDTAEEEGTPRLSPDELTIYFEAVRSANGASFDLYTATRPSRGAAFGAAQRVAGTSLATTDQEYAASVTDDGLTLFFERQLVSNSKSSIMMATRATPTAPFEAPAPVPDVNTTAYNANPFVRGDGTELHYVTIGASNTDLWTATKTGPGWTPSKDLVVNSGADEMDPVVSADGRTLYFASVRTLVAGHTDTNIWFSVRAAKGDTWGTPAPLPNVNTTYDEQPGWVSPDGCRLYLYSDRPGVGAQDIYVATRPN